MNETPSPAPKTTRKSLFEGRINRLGFFLGNVILILIPIALLLVYAVANFVISSSTPIDPSSDALFPEQSPAQSVLNIIIFLLGAVYIVMAIVIMFSLYIRRLHDMNLTGWLSVLLLINPISLVLYIVLQAVEGTPGANKYGAEERPTTLLGILGFTR